MTRMKRGMVMKSFFVLMMLVLFSTDAVAVSLERNPILPKETLEIITANGRIRFEVEIAGTREEQRLGLMNRTELAPNAGMLFPFPFPMPTAFWMHNTLIPLDMIFIDSQGKIIRIEERAAPQTDTPRPSGGDVLAVLEIAGGRAGELGIKSGDRVMHRFFRDSPVQSFPLDR